MRANRYTAARTLLCLAVARNDVLAAIAYGSARADWTDRHQVVTSLKALVDPADTTSFPGMTGPAGESFLEAVDEHSWPARLGLTKYPLNTRLLLADDGSMVAAEVGEAQAVPVVAGNWTSTTLTPRKFSAITVISDELARASSPAAAGAISDALARAVASAENRSFLSPGETGSVFSGQVTLSGSGSSLAQVDADLAALVDAVPNAHLGGVFAMGKSTARFLSQLRGSGGALAFPTMALSDARLFGLDVIVDDAMASAGSPNLRHIGLISPAEIVYGSDGGVELPRSKAAALKLDDAPTASADALYSLFQMNATGIKGARWSAWYARPNAAATLSVEF